MADKELRNYYEVLEIPYSATHEEIYSGYLKSKNAYSGDSVALYSLLTEEECKNMLNRIEEAYSVLSDPRKRREYDRARGLNQDGEVRPVNPITSQPIQTSPSTNRETKQRPLTNNLVEDTFSANREMIGDMVRNSAIADDFSISQTDVTVSKITAKKKFGLEYDQNENFDKEIENATEFSGEFLKKIREYKNVSVERLAEMTKISKTHIKNIEAENYDSLPALVYARGFVYQYAKCLKLNPDLVSNSYVVRMKTSKNGK